MKVLITDTISVFGHGLALEYLNTGAHVYGISKKTNIPDPIYAANYMVEAMGIILQEESGVYKDVRDLFFSREVSGQTSE